LSSIASANPRIIAYYPFWVNPPLMSLPVERATQITYAFANLTADGHITPGEPAFDLNKATMLPDGQLVQGNYAVLRALKLKHPDLKTVISIGGWHHSKHFSDVAANPQLRRTLAQSVLDFTAQYGFDGVELAWHFPGSGGKIGNSQRAEDGGNLLQLLKEIRALSQNRPLIVGLSLGPLDAQMAALPIAELMPWIDYGVVQAGDYTGAWSARTGHKSPLYRAEGNISIDLAINTLLKKGAVADKLVLIIPTQGMSFVGVPPAQQGFNQSHLGPSFGTWDDPKTGATGMIGQDEAAATIANGQLTANWDSAAKAMSYYSPALQQFISIESPQSVAEKLRYAKQKNLGGLALWDLSSDSSTHSFLKQIEHEYYPWRAWGHDAQQWWRHHPAWVETLFGVILASLIFIALGLGLRRYRERQLIEIEIAQLRHVMAITQLLPQALVGLRQASLVILNESQHQQLQAQAQPLFEYSERLAWQLEPLLLPPPASERVPAALAQDNELSLSAQRLQALAEFGQRLSEQRSLEKMLEVTMAFLAEESQVRGVALYQDGDLIANQGMPVPLTQAKSTAHQAVWAGETWDDYSLAIQFEQALSPDDTVFYRSLCQQFATVRGQLYELGRQPQLLSELYEVASRRAKILYIRADKGYSAIYASDLRAPQYITLRLRAIRMYFDERLLLQVHRSYLVNPKKVTHASKRGRDVWVLNIGNEEIPIARQYLSRLRLEFSQWFAE
ncbi:MAG: glycosyl hydrolase family 18 protein, partial [Deefgea sp.]